MADADEMKHCIIFGGSRGIGASIYSKLVSDNYNITVISRSAQNLGDCLEKALELHRYGDQLGRSASLGLTAIPCYVSMCHLGRIVQSFQCRICDDPSGIARISAALHRPLALPCDVTKEDEVKRTVQVAQKWFGPPDVLVNAAGINKDNLLVKTSVGDIHAQLDTNVVGSMLTSKAVLKSMLARRTGCIVNIGSAVGLLGNTGQCAYSASKAALVGFTKSLAKEVGGKGVRVNVIAPGFIETDMTSGLGERSKEIVKSLPIPRFGAPSEVAEAVKFVIENTYMTGQVLYVDGGLHITM